MSASLEEINRIADVSKTRIPRGDVRAYITKIYSGYRLQELDWKGNEAK